MAEPRTSPRACAAAALTGAALVAAAAAIPALIGTDVHVGVPPLHAHWKPRVTAGTVVAVATGVALVFAVPDLARRLPWRAVPALGWVATWVWVMALALVDGRAGLARVFARKGEYVYDARGVGDARSLLHEFISRIPRDSPDHWHTHVAGHPPGALLFFRALLDLGISDPFWIAVVVVTLGTSATAAVLVTLRLLGSESVARRALPWLVLAPAAVWIGVSADAFYAAVTAWGAALIAVAATTDRRLVVPAAGVAGGALLGMAVFLSYGLVLFGCVALGVLIAARRVTPLPWALAGAVAVVLVFWANGFAWWQAYPVLRERYYAGIASERPYWYWVWADVAAWTLTVGLVTWAALPAVVASWNDRDRGRRALAICATSALAAVALATLSGMSKAEVERIWLPFTVWIVAIPVLLVGRIVPARWGPWLLGSQVVLALLIQHVLVTRW